MPFKTFQVWYYYNFDCNNNKNAQFLSLAPITSLNFIFHRSSVNFVCSENPFCFFFKNKKIVTESGIHAH
jgi:hypothetical protein